MSDWTIALDDWLTVRHTHCTVCGRPDVLLRGVCGTRGQALVVSYTLCRRCVRHDGVKRAEQVLTARYEAGSKST